MPSELVLESSLVGLSACDAETTQVLQICQLDGKKWFYKKPPAEVTSPKAQKIRILNEAISGAIASFLSSETGDSFRTPTHRLVVDEHGSPVGVLSQEIDYDALGNYGTGSRGIRQVLSKDGLAEITTLRFFLKDPDGYTNVGYGKKDDKQLSSIDYGLSNYPYLSKTEGSLTKTEQERLPTDKKEMIFKINEESIFSFVMQPIGEDSVEFHTYHVFSSFHDTIALFCETDFEMARTFFAKVYNMLDVIEVKLTSGDFASKIIHKLGLDELSAKDQALCNDIIREHVHNAYILKGALQALANRSPSDFKAFVEGRSAGKASPVILKTFRGRASTGEDCSPSTPRGDGGGYDPGRFRREAIPDDHTPPGKKV